MAGYPCAGIDENVSEDGDDFRVWEAPNLS
jgi:hypothetical protein